MTPTINATYRHRDGGRLKVLRLFADSVEIQRDGWRPEWIRLATFSAVVTSKVDPKRDS